MSNLDVLCRYLELYFLSCEFANVIGCYQVVPAIVSAETGLTRDVLDAALAQLEQHSVIYRYGDYILVRRWFRHHAWESVLKGNVSKRAMRELDALPPELQQSWIESCLAAGAPQDFIDAISQQASPLQAPCKGLAHNNYNTTDNNNFNSTTTETLETAGRSLIFSSKLEPHRRLVEVTTAALDVTLAQQVADELEGVLDAVEFGRRPPIGSLQRWLSVVVESAESGVFRQELGLLVAKRRELDKAESARKAAKAAAIDANRNECELRVERAELALNSANDDVLKHLIDKVAHAFPIYSMRNQIAEMLAKRRIPRGPGCIEALAAIEAISLGDQ